MKGFFRKYLSVRGRLFARRSKKAIMAGKRGIGQEIQETRVMAKLFFRMLEAKLDMDKRKTPPTKEEVREALEQLKDVGRFSIFTSISLLPGGGFSLIGLELLARKLGVRNFTLIPSAFRKQNDPAKVKPIDEKEIIRQLEELQEKQKAPSDEKS